MTKSPLGSDFDRMRARRFRRDKRSARLYAETTNITVHSASSNTAEANSQLRSAPIWLILPLVVLMLPVALILLLFALDGTFSTGIPFVLSLFS